MIKTILRLQRGAAAMIVCVLASCKLLDVASPVRVPATHLDNPTFASVLLLGAIADFECAFGAYVTLSGAIADELYTSTLIFPAQWDRRLPSAGIADNAACAATLNISGVNTFGVWRPLSTARFQADDAYRRITAFPDSAVPGKNSLAATAAAYAGFTYTLIGEGFCEATFDVGAPLKPAAVLALAEQRFTTAITLAQQARNESVLNMAYVGRARVGLDLGKREQALADARAVPAGFARYATYSSDAPRRYNTVYLINQFLQYLTLDERYRNLTVGGVSDPRVPSADAKRKGNDGIVPLWVQLKYPTESSSIPIATWNEAQLIIAEIEGGQSAVSRINALRARAGLPLFSSSDANAIAQQVREERRRELFLDGHRLNDMIRFRLPFDSGRNLRGQTYSDMTCIPLPVIETNNNPNYPK
jgi:hypothetical protein